MRVGRRFTTTGIRTDHVVCDICETRIKPCGGWDSSTVNVGARLGEVFPEGDFRTVYEVDICPKCFTDKVIPAVESLGCKFRQRDAEDSTDEYYQRIVEAES